jgi:prevent-host-death family protein
LKQRNRLGEVLEAAQRHPASITRNGRPSVVVISAESYARRQRVARERLRQALVRAGSMRRPRESTRRRSRSGLLMKAEPLVLDANVWIAAVLVPTGTA